MDEKKLNISKVELDKLTQETNEYMNKVTERRGNCYFKVDSITLKESKEILDFLKSLRKKDDMIGKVRMDGDLERLIVTELVERSVSPKIDKKFIINYILDKIGDNIINIEDINEKCKEILDILKAKSKEDK